MIVVVFLLPHISLATCTPPTQYPGQCISQSDLTYKVSLCNASGNANSLACTEAKACDASLAIYMQDSTNYFNCKAAEENAATQAAADAAAKAEADRVANDQKAFDDAELNSCKNKLSQNFEVVDHFCRCKSGYTTQNNICTEMNHICTSTYGEGSYNTTKDQLNCTCKQGYTMTGRTCVSLPKPVPISPIITPTVLVIPPPAKVVEPVTKPIKNEAPKIKPALVNIVATSSATTTIIATTTEIIQVVAPIPAVQPAPVVEVPSPVKEEKVGIIRRIWRAIMSLW